MLLSATRASSVVWRAATTTTVAPSPSPRSTRYLPARSSPGSYTPTLSYDGRMRSSAVFVTLLGLVGCNSILGTRHFPVARDGNSGGDAAIDSAYTDARPDGVSCFGTFATICLAVTPRLPLV